MDRMQTVRYEMETERQGVCVFGLVGRVGEVKRKRAFSHEHVRDLLNCPVLSQWRVSDFTLLHFYLSSCFHCVFICLPLSLQL